LIFRLFGIYLTLSTGERPRKEKADNRDLVLLRLLDMGVWLNIYPNYLLYSMAQDLENKINFMYEDI